jgi:hypothetical protein
MCDTTREPLPIARAYKLVFTLKKCAGSTPVLSALQRIGEEKMLLKLVRFTVGLFFPLILQTEESPSCPFK